jgi:predicted regulator of Ras-like GTPase activity (Roadblock/LC7/MglB family)
LVEDFDLPDTGFETHVFSTAELVEGESLGFPSFPAAMPSAPEPPLPPPPAPAVVTPIRAAMPAMGSAVGLSPLQEDQAQGHIAELAELVDVIFARLIGADGSVILSAGDDSGDAALGSHLASLVETAAMEVQQLDLGDWQSVSVESAGVALLIAPVNTSASVAVLLRNPTRLGLLRRQIRKPLSGLRSLLAESSVS